MLEFIHIKNFQIWEDYRIDFTEGSNAIIGPTDGGKSAIRRALIWVVFNTPSGDDFRNWNGKDTIVTIGIDGHIITRMKGRCGNKYVLNDLKPFTGFGTKVPSKISEIVNMNLDINVLGQHDGAFLLSESSTKVAKFINNIVQLDNIDSSFSYISKKLTVIKQDVTYLEGRKETLIEKISTFAFLKTVKDSFKEAVEKVNKMELLEKDQEIVRELCSSIVDLLRILRDYKSILKKEHCILELSQKLTQHTLQSDLTDTLESFCTSISKTAHVIKKLEYPEALNDLITSGLDNLELVFGFEDSIDEMVNLCCGVIAATEQSELLHSIIDSETSVEHLEEMTSEYTNTLDMKATLSCHIDSISESLEAITKQKVIVVEKEELFKSEMPDECPLCGEAIPCC